MPALTRAFAVITAAALAVGLLVLGAGTARAADPICVGVQILSNGQCVNPAAEETTTTTTPVECPVDRNPRVPGCQNSGPIYHNPRGGNGGAWHDRWEGNRYIVLDGGSRFDVCDRSYRDYGDFLGRNRTYDSRLRALVDDRRFNDYRRSCGIQNTTIVNADCDNDDLNQYTIVSNSYRSSYDRYNGYLNTYRTHRTSENLRTLNRYYGDFDRNRRAYDDRRNRTTVICKDRTPPPVTYNITQTPQQACGCNDVPAVEPAPVTAPAPAPRYSKVPDTSSGVNDGDGSYPLARS